MPTLLEPARQTRIEAAYDVVVAGGGTAGVIAAVAAARNGADVLLLERGGFLGGHPVTQLLEHSVGWFDATGKATVGGLANVLVERLRRDGGSPGHIRDDTGYTKFRLPLEHEVVKSTVTQWIVDENIDFLTQTMVVGVQEDNDRLYVLVENKSGRHAFAANAIVDTTGDADVCAFSGCEFLSQDGAETQPVSLLFKLGGVNHDSLLDYVEANASGFKLDVEPGCLRDRPYVNLWGFGEFLQRGYAGGRLSLERNELHYAGHVLTNEAVINVTRVAADATSARELSRAEAVLRKQVLEFARFFRESVPGCENSFLAATASCVGVRESRRIRGLTVLTDEDVRAGRSRTDAVARGGFPIDSHDPRGKGMDGTEHVPRGYDIPFGTLVPDQGANIVVAGRCISAERRALASARITGTSMATGQAAGTAAALSARTGTPIRELVVNELQAVLREQGAIIHA